MSIIVQMGVPTREVTLGDVLVDFPTVRVDLVEFVPTREALMPYVRVQCEALDELTDRVRADERVAALSTLEREDGVGLYRIRWQSVPEGFPSACLHSDVCITDGWGTADRFRFTLRFHDQAALTAFHERCREESIPFCVDQLYEQRLSVDDEEPLTEPQAEALRLAYRRGYFDIPRDVTLDELSDELEISRQALSYRLRRGISAFVGGVLLDGPVLDE